MNLFLIRKIYYIVSIGYRQKLRSRVNRPTSSNALVQTKRPKRPIVRVVHDTFVPKITENRSPRAAPIDCDEADNSCEFVSEAEATSEQKQIVRLNQKIVKLRHALKEKNREEKNNQNTVKPTRRKETSKKTVKPVRADNKRKIVHRI